MSAPLSPFYTTVILIQHLFTSIIGIVGNLLVLIVYRNKLKDNESVTFFICHLAITDLACCLFLIPINCYHELNIGKIESDIMCKFHSFLNILNITYSCLLMTLVAFERFLSITYPLRNILTKTRTKFTLTLLFTMCIIVGFIGALSVGIFHKVYSFHTNATYINDILELEISKRYENNTSIIYSKNKPIGLKRSKRQQHDHDFILINSTINGQFDFNNQSIPFIWMATDNCFPNDQLISINHFTYIRLFQNFIVVFCFVIIFILYAFICGFVSKRRYLKFNRAKYYNDIIERSKKDNFNMIQVEEPMLKSEISKNEFGFDNMIEPSPSLSNKKEIYVMPRIILNDNSQSEIEIFGENEKHIETYNYDKSTQTETSSITKLKNHEIKTISQNNKMISYKINDKNQSLNETTINYKYNQLNYSSILLANMKTAFMLFVVTVIMAVVYTPALLTSLSYLPYNPIYWNIIYINNAINPLVYSFMNSNFRISLKKTFSKYLKRCYSS